MGEVFTKVVVSDISLLKEEDDDDAVKTEEIPDLEKMSSSSLETDKVVSTDSRHAMYAVDGDMEFPEGGKEAYLSLLGCFIVLIFPFGMFSSLGVMAAWLQMNELMMDSASDTAWIFSINLFVSFLTLVFSGVYFDRNGTRTLIVVGWLFTTVSMIGTANCYKIWHFILAFSILNGIGGGLILAPGFGCVAQFFSKKRGLMTSVAAVGGSIGGILFPLMLSHLYEQIGFAWSMRCMALLSTFCYGVGFFLMKERFHEVPRDLTKWQNFLSYLAVIDFKYLLDAKYGLVVLASSVGQASAFVISTYLSSYSMSEGQSLDTANSLLSVSQACSIPGLFVTGYFSDRYGRFNVMILVLLICGILTYAILLPGGADLNAQYGFTAVWGLFVGALYSLLPVCCAQISKTEDFGKRYGTMYFFVSCATLITLPVGGVIIDIGYPYQFINCLVYYSGSLMFASAVVFWIAKGLYVGWNPLAKF